MRPARLLAFLLLACLAACDTLPSRQASVTEFEQAQRAAALEAQQQGRLLLAVNLWESLLPLESTSAEAQEAIAALEKKIRSRANSAFRNGLAAYRIGDYRQGDVWMLKVLALEPGREDALAQLRGSTSKRARAQQIAKSRGENELAMARQREPRRVEPAESPMRALYNSGEYTAVLAMASQENHQPTAEDPPMLRSSHIALADQAKRAQQQDLELFHLMSAMKSVPLADDPLLARSQTLRATLSIDWYRKGNSLMKTDLPAAIAALEKSVAYDPENHSAQLKLKQAKTLQSNLEKIQAR